MRFRGVSHVELNVLNYEASIPFYDRMFGWLSYSSFQTLGIGGYTATYYTAFPHSCIGIQPAKTPGRVRHEEMTAGINHIALWAKSKREIDRFYREFLLKEGIIVLDPPDWCQEYAPNYYVVFFLDPSGIRWELMHYSIIPSPVALYKWLKLLAKIGRQHPEWNRHPLIQCRTKLPRKTCV